MKHRLLQWGGAGLLLAGVIAACDAQVDTGYQGEPLLTLKGQVQSVVVSAPEADVGVLWLTSDAANGCSGPQKSGIGFASGSYNPDVDVACTDACGRQPEGAEGLDVWEDCQHACGSDIEVGFIIEYHACVDGAIGQTAPVVGDFPAQFSLDMLQPPPRRAFMPSDTGERVALGFFVALAPNAPSLRVSMQSEPPAWLLGASETHVLVYAADPVKADSSWGAYLGGVALPIGYHLLRVQDGNRCGLSDDGSELDPDLAPPPFGAVEPALAPQPDTQPMADSDGIPVDVASAESPDASAEPDDTDVSAEPDDPDVSAEPDYAAVALVCGNGVCEAPENCNNCSDCDGCDDGSAGRNSGRLYGDLGYYCQSASTLVPAAPGGEADIRLLIAPPEVIDWPTL